MSKHNLSDYWDTQNVPDREKFCRLAKERIYGMAFDGLKDKAINSSKSWLFKLIIPKAERRCHSWYLTKIDRKNVKIISKLRLRGHHLAVEVGSWLDIPRELRNCSTCLEVEDEGHVVMSCSRYTHLRERYILREFRLRPKQTENEELSILLNSENRRAIDNLAVFFRKALVIHNEYAEAYIREQLGGNAAH